MNRRGFLQRLLGAVAIAATPVAAKVAEWTPPETISLRGEWGEGIAWGQWLTPAEVRAIELLQMPAPDGVLTEQVGWTVEDIVRHFRVPSSLLVTQYQTNLAAIRAERWLRRADER